MENSLKLLGTDYLDSVLIHDPEDIEVPLAKDHALEELLRLKEQGIVRHVGLGVRDHAFHRRAMATGHIDIVLTYLDYTLIEQSAAQGVFPDARRHGGAVILATAWDSSTAFSQVRRMREPTVCGPGSRCTSFCRMRFVSVR